MKRVIENPFAQNSGIQDSVKNFYSSVEKRPLGVYGKYLVMAAMALSTQACSRFMANAPGIGGTETKSSFYESPSEQFKLRWQHLPEGLYLPESDEQQFDNDKAQKTGGSRQFVEHVKISQDAPRPDQPACIIKNRPGESISPWLERGFTRMVYYSSLTDSYNLRIEDSRTQSLPFETDDMRRLDENRPMVDAWSRNWPPSLVERFSPTGPPIDYPKTEAQPNIQPTDVASLAFQDKNIKQKIESAVVIDVLNQVQGSQRSEVFQEVENVLRPRNISGLITLDAKQDKVKQAPESDPKSFSFDDRVDSLLNGLLTINQDIADHNLELINQVISTMPSEQGAIYQKDLRFLIISNQPSTRFIGRVDDFQIILPIPIPDPNIDKEVWHAIEIGEHIEPKIWKKMTDQQKEENIKLMKIRILSQRQKLIDEAKEAKLQSINKAMEMYLVFVQARLAKKYGKEKAQQMLTRESHVLGTEVDYDFRFTRLGQGNAMMILHLNVHNPLIEPEQ